MPERLVINPDVRFGTSYLSIEHETASVESEVLMDKIDGEMLFFTAYDICKYFRFSYIDNEIHIILDIAKLDKHFIFYFNELLEKIIVNIKN